MNKFLLILLISCILLLLYVSTLFFTTNTKRKNIAKVVYGCSILMDDALHQNCMKDYKSDGLCDILGELVLKYGVCGCDCPVVEKEKK